MVIQRAQEKSQSDMLFNKIIQHVLECNATKINIGESSYFFVN
jgi:hypothetical protein